MATKTKPKKEPAALAPAPAVTTPVAPVTSAGTATPEPLKKSPAQDTIDTEKARVAAEKDKAASRPAAQTEAERIAESRQALKVPCPVGTKFFESPKGYIILGEATRGTVLCREEGIQINPMRGASRRAD